VSARSPGLGRTATEAATTLPAAAARDLIQVVRDEVAAAARLTLALGLALAVGGFVLLLAKLSIWQLVVPTGNPWTLAGLSIALGLAVGLVVALDQLRDLGLLAISRRLAQRLAAPMVLAVAQQPGRSDIAAGQALRDVEELRRNLAGPVLTALADAVLVPAMVLALLVFHWAFAAWALFFAVLAALLSIAGDRLTRRTLVVSNDAHARTSALVADAMRCAEAVEAMGLRDTLAARWEARLADSAEALGRAQSGARWIGAGIAALYAIGSGGALVVGTLISMGGVDVGFGMILAMLLTGQVIGPFARLGGSLHEWARRSAPGAGCPACSGRRRRPRPASHSLPRRAAELDA
jgi:ABC-type protease/lipase transport system fused ATPase/permease subunit